MIKIALVLIFTVVTFFILQRLDKTRQKQGTAMQSKIALFFFLLVLFIAIVYWFDVGSLFEIKDIPATKVKLGGGAHTMELERSIISEIREDVIVGPAPF